MRNKLFALLLVVFFLLGAGIFLLPQNEYSAMEKRKLSINSDIEIGSKLSSEAESVLKDQFYSRDVLTSKYYEIKIALSKPFSKNSLYNITLNYLSDNVIEIDGGYLINEVVDYSEDEIQSAAARGYNLNEFANLHPDIKVYAYFPTRIEELLNEDYFFQTACRDAYTNQLSGDISFDGLNIESVEDHQKYFFKSDRHWNIVGAYQAYTDIIKMIGKDFEIGEPKQIASEITYEYIFHGNISSQIGKLGEGDQISDYELEGIGNFDYYIDGNKTEFGIAKKDYAENGNNTIYSDYDFYFGDNNFLRVFEFHQEDKPNILILGDSYINSNMQWIASHFNNTHIIDLRAKTEGFSLNSYLEENDIDIVLVSLGYEDMFINGNLYIPLD